MDASKLFCFRVIIISLFSLSLIQISHCNVNKIRVFSAALDAIVKDFYIKNSLKFDIVAADVNNCNFAGSVIQNIAKKNYAVTNQISFIDLTNLNHMNLSRSTIIFLEGDSFSSENLRKINILNVDYMRVRHFIVIQDWIENRSVITDFQSSLNQISYLTYDSAIDIIKLNQISITCGNNQRAKSIKNVINKFPLKNMMWKTDSFETNDNVRNLGGCTYQVLCSQCVGRNASNSFALKILELVEKKLNFNSEILVKDDGKVTFSFEIASLSTAVTYLYYVSVFDVQEHTLLFSTGEPYSPFDKLIIPFDFEVWIALAVTFAIGFSTVIILMKTCRIGWQKFVFGSNVRTPGLNIMIAFFGQGQNILPGRNFSRYMLMIFILFCLIIRTGYQGVQFEMIYMVRYTEFKFKLLKPFFYHCFFSQGCKKTES